MELRSRKDGSKTLWRNTLPNIECSRYALNVPPLSAFRHVRLPYYQQVLSNKELIFVLIYTSDQSGNQIGWIAKSSGVAGMYVYLKWLGVEKDPTIMGKWLNISDPRLVLAMNVPKERFKLVAPQAVVNSCSLDLTSSFISSTQLGQDVNDELKVLTHPESGLREGMLCEILDGSSLAAGCQVRAGIIKSIVGRRICIAVTGERTNEPESYVWVDKYNNHVFYVGWAILNGYAISASDSYLTHCRAIASALRAGTTPPYSDNDLPRQALMNIAATEARFNRVGSFVRRMKLEVQDPFSQRNNELHVATVYKVFEDGYLLVSLDGPDAEHDVFPVHELSPLLFPVGYAYRNSIPLQTPPDVKNFDWERYLKATNSAAAPSTLFRPDPSMERLRDFPVGGKIEAFDVIEKNAICPATIKRHCGRLLLISFDGWNEDYDQLVDIDSPDIFPIGWCDTHGVPLDVWSDAGDSSAQSSQSSQCMSVENSYMVEFLQMAVDSVAVKEENE